MSNPTQEALCAQFSPGDRVRYVPYHAHGDTAHKDCENGEVTHVGTFGVHVLFAGKTYSQACNPDQLIIQREVPTVAGYVTLGRGVVAFCQTRTGTVMHAPKLESVSWRVNCKLCRHHLGMQGAPIP